MTEIVTEIPTESPGYFRGGDESTAALIRGYAARDAGRLDDAASDFRTAVAADPACAEALGALGDVLAELGKPLDAAAIYEQAAGLEPGRLVWLDAQAGALAAAGQAEAAAAVYRRLLERRPDAVAAHRGLARELARLGDRAGAIRHGREALFLDPDDAEAATILADLLLDSGEALAAVEVIQPCLRRQPGHGPLRLRLGRAWAGLGEPARALEVLRMVRAQDPDDSLGAGRLIGQLETGMTDELPQTYVRTLFDQYADRFDTDLTVKLKYQAPQVLRQAVMSLGGPLAGLDVLDLGCGTGLAGVEFRPLARLLAGVDLSPRMIAKARERALYDRLEVGEAVAALFQADAAWDLVVAADVLVYLGDLAPLMSGMAAALRPGGRFAATVERLDGTGYALSPSRRFAHGIDHVRTVAAGAGLTVRSMADTVPRWEKRAPVSGLVFVLEKPLQPA